MTLRAFDPRILTNYSEPKYLLHFQWNNEKQKIYRYSLVEVINLSEISESKQKKDEVGLTQKQIWEKKYNGSY
tara:strand:- start:121 stop:339 length:219 start_codon:yes stop_codon:yes gene_type:complete